MNSGMIRRKNTTEKVLTEIQVTMVTEHPTQSLTKMGKIKWKNSFLFNITTYFSSDTELTFKKLVSFCFFKLNIDEIICSIFFTCNLFFLTKMNEFQIY